MNLLAPISSIMTRDILTIGPEESLARIEELFGTKRIHHLPVTDNGKLVGMISKSDYLFFKRGFIHNNAEEKWDEVRLKSHKVSEIMTKGVARLEETDKINVVLEVFKENLFHAIPIVDEDNMLVGIVTTYDIIVRLAEERKAINEYIKK